MCDSVPEKNFFNDLDVLTSFIKKKNASNYALPLSIKEEAGYSAETDTSKLINQSEGIRWLTGGVTSSPTLVALPSAGDHQGRGAALRSAGQSTLRELRLRPGPLLL